MTADRSAGWEKVARQFMTIRSDIGTELVRSWAARSLPPSSDILDIGCGSGVPIATALVGDGFRVWGIDASPTLVAAYQRHLPDMPAACEPAQDSTFFDRTFAGIISVGVIFLLDQRDQIRLLHNVARALEPGGRFLFSAPREQCRWTDTLTGRLSVSLGTAAYARHLSAARLHLAACHSDEGGNNYYDVLRDDQAPAR